MTKRVRNSSSSPSHIPIGEAPSLTVPALVRFDVGPCGTIHLRGPGIHTFMVILASFGPDFDV
jgi:hypothetical protein